MALDCIVGVVGRWVKEEDGAGDDLLELDVERLEALLLLLLFELEPLVFEWSSLLLLDSVWVEEDLAVADVMNDDDDDGDEELVGLVLVTTSLDEDVPFEVVELYEVVVVLTFVVFDVDVVIDWVDSVFMVGSVFMLPLMLDEAFLLLLELTVELNNNKFDKVDFFFHL